MSDRRKPAITQRNEPPPIVHERNESEMWSPADEVRAARDVGIVLEQMSLASLLYHLFFGEERD